MKNGDLKERVFDAAHNWVALEDQAEKPGAKISVLARLTRGEDQRRIRHASHGRDTSHRIMDIIAASKPMVKAKIRR